MAKKRVDWDSLNPDWIAGIKSKAVLSDEYGISRAAMNKHYSELGIERSLAQKIRDKANAIVDRDAAGANEVTCNLNEVTSSNEVTPPAGLDLSDEEENRIVEANAIVLSAAIRRHRAGVVKAWEVVDMLMDELREQTANKDLYEQLGELLYAPDKNGTDKLNEVYRKAMSLPSRAGTAKQLIDAIKIAVTLEREVLNISSGGGDGEGANNGGNNTTIINIGLPATSGFFGRITATGGGRTLPQSVQDRPLLSASVRT